MSHAPSLLFPSHLSTTSLSTCGPTRPSTRPSTRPLMLSSSHVDFPCADPSNVSFGPTAETRSPISYEPNSRIVDNSTEVKPMFFHRPSMTSTYDSAESIATLPPESDVDDEQIWNMLASPLYLQEREARADQPRVYHSFRENSVSSSSHFREIAGKPAAVFSHTRRSSQETAFPEDINQFKEKVKLSSGSLIRKKLREQFLKNKEIIYSQKQHLKSWSKNVKLILLTLCIREFQRQAHSNCLELDSVTCGHEESRTEHGRLHEELVQREKALRETRIRNIHEVEELKRSQEMRIDEF